MRKIEYGNLDKLVAERIMGKKVVWTSLHIDPETNREYLALDDKGDMPILQILEDGELKPLSHYSTDIREALKIISKLIEHGFVVHINGYHPNYYEVVVCTADYKSCKACYKVSSINQLPLAICVAGLLAIGVPKEEIDALVMI